MNRVWVSNLQSVVVSASILLTLSQTSAIAEDTPLISSAAVSYQLTDSIYAEAKSILNEKVPDGTRIGAVVRLYNDGSRVARVPDYEIRAKTKDGIEYTLRPSSVNAVTIQPKEKVELSYMIVVERSDAFSLSELSWVDVDEVVYPRKETAMLSIPVSSLEWQGGSTAASEYISVKKWGESFTIPVLSSTIVFTPVSAIWQNTPHGPVTVVIIEAENKGEIKESIPDFRINGKSDKKVYTGKRVEQETMPLEPGEKVQLHYSIPIENKVSLNSLQVLTPESFVEASQTNIQYTIGRFYIELPKDPGGSSFVNQLQRYEIGKPIRFDPLNKLIHPEVDVSLVELHLHKAEGDGYQTVIAKFKLDNRSDSPVPVPNFLAQLMSADGRSYMGTRQAAAAQTLAPNLSYVVSYSFNVPDSEKGEKLAMKLLDGDIAPPFNIPIAAFQTKVQTETGDSLLAFYPYSVKLSDWTVSALYSESKYTYKLKMNLDISHQDNVVVDQNFSKMKIELADQQGRVISSETLPFTGMNRLVSGWQTIAFNDLQTDQFEYPLSVNFYEAIDTPFGEAKRLVKTVRQ